MFVGLNAAGSATIFFNELDADSLGIIKYFEHQGPIISEPGVMMTDGVSKIWNEIPDQPEPILKSKNQLEILQAQIKALSDQNDFLEDCIVEMAGEVYS